MLGKGERAICEDLLKAGRIVTQSTYICEGISVEYFCIESDGWLYDMTKHDGEWVYFHRGGLA